MASPFVAGVAALLKAADETLTPAEIRALLIETGNNDTEINPAPGAVDPGPGVRPDAFAAVASVLGVELIEPSIEIMSPSNGSEHTGSIVFSSDVVTSFGQTVPITWTSSLDGEIGQGETTIATLTPGTHIIEVQLGPDVFGGEPATDTITVEVVAPTGQILWPVERTTTVPVNGSIDFIGDIRTPFGLIVPDENVRWTVLNTLTGHVSVVPGYHAELGSDILGPEAGRTFAVSLQVEGESSGTTSWSEVDSRFVVTVSPDENLPSASIMSPEVATLILGPGAMNSSIDFAGVGREPTGFGRPPVIPGTEYRWVATNERGIERQLCVGSGFPNSGGGGIVLPRDCSSFTASLELDPRSEGNSTTWLVTLEVAWQDTFIAMDSTRLVLTTFVPEP